MNNTALEKSTTQSQRLAAVPQTGQNNLAKINMRELKELAEIMVASGAFSDIKQVAQAQVKILAGAELGFSPIVSMTGIHFFQGKVTIGSNLQASLIKESGKYDYKITESSDKACAIEFYQIGPNGQRTLMGVPIRYTIGDATNSGLAGKDNWKKFPADMLFAACIRQGARRYCGDVLRGITAESDTEVDVQMSLLEEKPADIIEVEGELIDTATGEIVDAEPVEEAPQPQADVAAPIEAVPVIEPETTLEQIRNLITVKFNGDEEEVRKFLKGRDPSVMPESALVKLLDELRAF